MLSLVEQLQPPSIPGLDDVDSLPRLFSGPIEDEDDYYSDLEGDDEDDLDDDDLDNEDEDFEDEEDDEKEEEEDFDDDEDDLG